MSPNTGEVGLPFRWLRLYLPGSRGSRGCKLGFDEVPSAFQAILWGSSLCYMGSILYGQFEIRQGFPEGVRCQ